MPFSHVTKSRFKVQELWLPRILIPLPSVGFYPNGMSVDEVCHPLSWFKCYVVQKEYHMMLYVIVVIFLITLLIHNLIYMYIGVPTYF